MPNVTKGRKPEVSIVGAGRLGTALAIALAGQGYSIRYLVARHRERALKAAVLLDAPVKVLVAKQLPELPAPDLLIISTPDDQIARVAGVLATLKTKTPRKPIVLHTSGALSSKVLTPLRARGWSIGSIHPLISVSDPEAGARSLRGVFWCIEGDRGALRAAKTMVRDLGGHSFLLGSNEKPLYHAAAVMASGNVVALFDVALEMLAQCGVTPKQAQRILAPLLESTIRNLAVTDPTRALTGTFARGDLDTVEQHLEALKGDRLEDARELYRLLGRRALSLSASNGLDPQIVKRIKKALTS